MEITAIVIYKGEGREGRQKSIVEFKRQLVNISFIFICIISIHISFPKREIPFFILKM